MRGLPFPRAGRQLFPRLLHIYIATTPRSNAAPSLAFTDESGRLLHRLPLDRFPPHPAGRPNSAPPARLQLAFRAAVYALWNGRRLGYRRIAVHCDDPAAVAQITGASPVDPDVIGLYLEARALMHLYKRTTIDLGELMLPVLEPWQPAVKCATSASS